MSRRWTASDLSSLKERAQEPRLGVDGYTGIPGGSIADPSPSGAVRRKYRNQPVEHNGQKFDSKRELQVWKDLTQMVTMGAARSLIRQVSLPLPLTTRRIRVDFVLVGLDGRYRWIDAKGLETAAWALKRQVVREAYGIEIELW